jgi:hypothetical protein
VFRSRIALLIDRTRNVKIPGGTELDLNESEVKTIAKEAGKNAALTILKDMQRYGQYMSREQAFATASSWVDNYLEEHDREPVKIEITMMVVGMVYSWRGFLSKIPAWLNSHPTCTMDVCVLLADSEYLRKLPIATRTENKWAEESARRIIDIQNMVDSLKPNCKNRLKCIVKTYEMLPQYHGIVINRQHLYLGRTDWNFDVPIGNKPELTVGNKPELTVGQNRYRYFDLERNEGADKGKERVGLFLNWHKFFWEHFSKEIYLHPRESASHNAPAL